MNKTVTIFKVIIGVFAISLFFEIFAVMIGILTDYFVGQLTGELSKVSGYVAGTAKIFFARAFLAVALIEAVYWITKRVHFDNLKKVTLSTYTFSVLLSIIPTLFSLKDIDSKSWAGSLYSFLFASITFYIVRKYIIGRFNTLPYYSLNFPKPIREKNINVFKNLIEPFGTIFFTILQPKYVQNRIGDEEFFSNFELSKSEIEVINIEENLNKKEPFKFSILKSLVSSCILSITILYLSNSLDLYLLIAMTLSGGMTYFALSTSISQYWSFLYIPCLIFSSFLGLNMYKVYNGAVSFESYILVVCIAVVFLALASKHYSEIVQDEIKVNPVGSNYRGAGILLGFGLAHLTATFFIALFASILVGGAFIFIWRSLSTFMKLDSQEGTYFIYASYFWVVLFSITFLLAVPIFMRLFTRTQSKYEPALGFAVLKSIKVSAVVAFSIIIAHFFLSQYHMQNSAFRFIEGITISLFFSSLVSVVINAAGSWYKNIDKVFVSGFFLSIIFYSLLPILVLTTRILYVSGDRIKNSDVLDYSISNPKFYLISIIAGLVYLLTWHFYGYIKYLIYLLEMPYNFVLLTIDSIFTKKKSGIKYHSALYNSRANFKYPFLALHLSEIWSSEFIDSKLVISRLSHKGYVNEIVESLKIYFWITFNKLDKEDQIIKLLEGVDKKRELIDNQHLKSEISKKLEGFHTILTQYFEASEGSSTKIQYSFLQKHFSPSNLFCKLVLFPFIVKNRIMHVLWPRAKAIGVNTPSS